MAQEEFFKNVDRYLYNEMDVAEKAAFEKQMAADSELLEEVQIRKKAMQTLDQEKYRNLRNDLMDRGHKNWKKKPGPNPLAIAASIALLILAGYFLSPYLSSSKSPQGPISSTLTAEQILQELKRPNISGNLNGEGNQDWYKALRLYQKGKCDLAIPALEKLLEDPVFQMTFKGQQARLMTGYCHIENQKPEEAIKILKEIPKVTDVYVDGQWYLIYAQLQANNLPTALRSLRKMATKKRGKYLTKAKALLPHLEALKE